jgi:hypothetical protein
MFWNGSPTTEEGGEIGTNPAIGFIGLKGCGAIGVGVVDRLVYGGVRVGLFLGDDFGDLLEATELGLVITLDQGLLFVVVGVALRLVEVDTEEDVGDEGPRLYQVGSSCKLTMDIVCDRLY